MATTLTLGTRGSRLALWQTAHVASRLTAVWPEVRCDTVRIVTRGDRVGDTPLPAIGGKGLFTAELEAALRRGEIDLAVHSLKDLPVVMPDGLTLGAMVDRADVRDVLIAHHGQTLEQLPAGAVVGTSSLRRQAQLLAARPDLRVRPIRGNVETRLEKVLKGGAYDAIILAAAGIMRLGLEEYVTQWLPLAVMLPAPGQGALAVQCRAEDEPVLELLLAIDNGDVRACVTAERVFLQTLGGGCATPVAALATGGRSGVHLTAVVASVDGRRQVRVNDQGPEPGLLGRELAEKALVEGAARILSLPLPYRRPLDGRRVLVTRSSVQAEIFAARLRARGAIPVLLPAIDVIALPTDALNAALVDAGDYDWLLFTSVNAVEHFLRAHKGERLPPVAAVGTATLDSLASAGIEVAYVPDVFTGVALAAGLGELVGRRVLLPRAREGRPDIVAALRARGAIVDDVPIYEIRSATPSLEARVEWDRGVDVATFTSPSSVRNFLALVGVDSSDKWPPATAVACIGPSTAAEARGRGLVVAIQPAAYTIDGLVDAIEDFFQVPDD